MPRVFASRPAPGRHRDAPVAPPEHDVLRLGRMLGNQRLQRVLATRTIQRVRAEKDAPTVAKALYGKDDEKAQADTLAILKTAERIPFYDPVLELAATGKVLNPEGLKIAVEELHAKSRDTKDTTGPIGMAHELLYARAMAQSGKAVQLGAWKPDHLQRGMQAMGAEVESLGPYLKGLATKELPLATGWGGDTVLWEADKQEGKSFTVTTIQHKVVTSKQAEAITRELLNAAEQLSGDRLERPLPGIKVASLVLTDPAHEGLGAAALSERIAKTLHPRLRPNVQRVEVTTTSALFVFTITMDAVTLEREEKSGYVAELTGMTPKRVEGKADLQAAEEPQDEEERTDQQLLEEARSSRSKALEVVADPLVAIRAAVKYVNSPPPTPEPPKQPATPKKGQEQTAAAAQEKRQQEYQKKREQHAEKQSEWEKGLPAANLTITQFTVQGEKYAKLVDAMQFMYDGWKSFGTVEATAKKSGPYKPAQTQMKERLDEGKLLIDADRKQAEQKWALEHPEMAKRFAADERRQAAQRLLDGRREGKKDFKTYNDARSKRFNSVKTRLAKDTTGEAPTTLTARLIGQWSDENPDDAQTILEHDGEFTAETWILTDDDELMKTEIRAIVEAESNPDYVGTGASAKRAEQDKAAKQQRKLVAQQQAEQHATLVAVLSKHARFDPEKIERILATLGRVKEKEGNASAVAKIVDRLTEALSSAWQLEEGKIDRELLREATASIETAGGGITYLSALTEVEEAGRAATTAKGVMIGQWYALDKGSHATWEEADHAMRKKPKKERNYATEQEVDVSYYTGEQLHVHEVAADVWVLRDKLLKDTKAKQRESYLTLRRRGAQVTYVLSSDEEWQKIFEFSVARNERDKPMEAPMVKFLVANEMRLVIKGEVLDKSGLEARASAYSKRTEQSIAQ